MNISFGKLIERCYSQKNEKQQKISDILNNYFNTRKELYKKESINAPEIITLSDMIELDMGADVFVKHEENGDTEIKLRENNMTKEFMDKNSWLEPEDRVPLILKSKSSITNIEEKIKDYAKKCCERSGAYDLLKVD